MATAQDIITSALTVLGVTFPGQTPSTSMSNDALTRLNNMLASWAVERLLIYAIQVNLWPLVSGTKAYTIGATGTFAGTRPISIDRANIVLPTTLLRTPLKLVTTREWGEITDQGATSLVPTVLYDDYEYPNSNLLVWPTPNAASIQLELFTWQVLESFTTLADTFSMPPEYQQAISYNLATVLSMVYGRPMSPEATQVATDSKNAISAVNAPPTHISGAGEEAAAAAQVSQSAASQPPQNLVPQIRR